MISVPRLGVCLCLLTASGCFALDSSDLLFDLSFDNGVEAEFSRGAAHSLNQPDPVAQRLVPGLIGKGYAFGGKGSGIVFSTGDAADRVSLESYDSHANLFGNSGTVSLWVTALHGINNRDHEYFKAAESQGVLRIYRNLYTQHAANYGQGGAGTYDGVMGPGKWMNFVVTFQKGEAKIFFNGDPAGIIVNPGVLDPTPAKFTVAAESTATAPSQSKELADDTIIDEVQIFSRPLTEQEVKSLWERGHQTFDIAGVGYPVWKPKREYAGHAVVAPRVTNPVQWNTIPSHGGWIERRVGVLDHDPGQIKFAVDDKNLYVAFRCEVDASIQADPTHIKYPGGEFLAGKTARDADLAGDDTVQLALRGKDGHDYRITFNARGALRDERDGDVARNANLTGTSRSDLKDWTAEYAIPLAELGMTPGETVDFNVIRSWKLFSSAQNSLCADVQSQFGFGKLTLGAPASAAVESLGDPGNGVLKIKGAISGPAGKYVVKARAAGFKIEQPVEVKDALASFVIDKPLDHPDDMALIVEVFDPGGKPILTRTIPFVYAAKALVEVAEYPNHDWLDVTVTPSTMDRTGLSSRIEVMRDTKAVLTQTIATFDQLKKTVRFESKPLPLGDYQVVTTMLRGGQQIGQDRRAYHKEPPPEWLHSKAGIIDGPPIPWTEPRVRGMTVNLLGKAITFQKTVLPARIVSNGQDLLAGPVRVRVKRGGQESVITAGKFKFTEVTRREARWHSSASDGDLSIEIDGTTQFDGFTWMKTTLRGGKVEHLAVEVPVRPSCATLSTLAENGLVTGKPMTGTFSHWLGNEKAGIAWYWEHQCTWELAGEPVRVTPGANETVVSIPFLQKPLDLAKPRVIEWGLAISPTKPLRADWRELQLAGGETYAYADYTLKRGNYAKPQLKPEDYKSMWEGVAYSDKIGRPQVGWYGYGPFMWSGAPEYAKLWLEWKVSPGEAQRPDPNSDSWGGSSCHNSSGSDLQMDLLAKYVKQYPQRGVYFDCMTLNYACDNGLHGCGYADDAGARRPATVLLGARRHYERVYNIIKDADPRLGWIRHHDWTPSIATAAFCDDNWIGEGMISAILASPTKNYYSIVPLSAARLWFANEHWGHLTSWLTELACSAGSDLEAQAGWYSKMIAPSKDGPHGKWTLPRWKDYEHVAGIGVVHDMWQIGGNDLELPWFWVNQLERYMHWDRHVQFTGYWELRDELKMDGCVPEQIVCSIYRRPPGMPKPDIKYPVEDHSPTSWANFHVADDVRAKLAAIGDNRAGWLLVAPMNNTDQDVTVTLRPNLKKLGFASLRNGRLRDVFRAYGFAWQPMAGWRPNGAVESPYIEMQGHEEIFPLVDGVANVTIPKRSFRMLLLEANHEAARQPAK